MGGIAIAIAILIAMALYLLDKHGLLRRAIIITTKVFGFACLAAIVIVGMVWGFQLWKTSRAAKQATKPDSGNDTGWQAVSESPVPNTRKTYTLSYAEFARTKLFRNSTLEGKISILRDTDSLFASVDKSAEQTIVKRLVDETKTAPEFDLPDDAMCAFDEVLFRSLGERLVTPCHYKLETASCAASPLAVPMRGFALQDDNKPCFTVKGK